VGQKPVSIVRIVRNMYIKRLGKTQLVRGSKEGVYTVTMVE